MAQTQITGKRLQINKANSSMVIAVGIAAFLVTFSAIASRTLLGQRSYQARVIAKKEIARNTLNQNVENVDKLAVAYQSFVETSDNILGGNPKGNSEKDGDNAKIVLDALPSKYDFPALTTSLEKMITSNNFNLIGVTGTDDEVNQAANASNPNPTPVEMPYEVSVKVNSYASLQNLFGLFERSIRPFKTQQLVMSSDGGSIEVVATGVSYYQPAKSLEIQKEVVR